jgi:putative ABC transport system permease protein
MNVFRIAWRSIQHRGLGSLLTILSMALGVMLVVGVLTVHGVVSQSFKSNSNFAYDLIIGPSGSRMQVTMNTVFYLSSPVENIPYEYYLAFCDEDRRREELQHSVAWQTLLLRQDASAAVGRMQAALPGSGMGLLASLALDEGRRAVEERRIGLNTGGSMNHLTEMAIPVALGDYLDTFRVVGTTPDFFEHIVLDIDTGEKLAFAEGRAFHRFDPEHHWYEAVLGSRVARELGLSAGDVIYPIHGDPSSDSAHTHEQGFTIVGILESTGTPHDRAAFVNLEGFYLLDGHTKPVDERLLTDPMSGGDDEAGEPADIPAGTAEDSGTNGQPDAQAETPVPVRAAIPPLPVEQREVTSVLVRSAPPSEEEDDEFASIGAGYVIQSGVNEGALESTLRWSDYRPRRAKEEVQAISPVAEVTSLFDNFVSPVRWILLVLTVMICVVSSISILVGIYSSMAQRRREIAVMRALGASRNRVLSITLLEAITLAVLGGAIGWVGGHVLNAAVGPMVESRTGVSIGFWDFAPGVPIGAIPGLSGLSRIGGIDLEWIRISTEVFLIPGLIGLAILVGVYPAISAYRTDVARSLD